MANIDIEMGEFKKVSTLANSDYVVVNLSDGTQGAIKVSDIASVVAGMTPFVRLFGNSYTSEGISSIDDILDTSIRYCSISYGTLNLPFDYCMIFTSINGQYGFQLAFDVTKNSFAFRTRVYNEWQNSWSII